MQIGGRSTAAAVVRPCPRWQLSSCQVNSGKWCLGRGVHRRQHCARRCGQDTSMVTLIALCPASVGRRPRMRVPEGAPCGHHGPELCVVRGALRRCCHHCARPQLWQAASPRAPRTPCVMLYSVGQGRKGVPAFYGKTVRGLWHNPVKSAQAPRPWHHVRVQAGPCQDNLEGFRPSGREFLLQLHKPSSDSAHVANVDCL